MVSRFFLGISEAGFGPGIPYLLSFFYLRHEVGYIYFEITLSYVVLNFESQCIVPEQDPVSTSDTCFIILGFLTSRSNADSEKLTHRHLSLCRSFSNKFFWCISVWVGQTPY